MKSLIYFALDGRTATEDEALLNGMLRDGFGCRQRLMMRDNGIPTLIADNGQAAYEDRISDAWMGAAAPTTPPVVERIMGDSLTGQSAYESRIANAWRMPVNG